MIDINELRRLAQAATPGPWHATKSVETNSWAVWSDTTRLMELRPTKTVDMYQVSNTATFIAAANPAAISELLDRLEAAEPESIEQARLNGMGAERELALMAKLEAAEKERDELRADKEALEREAVRLVEQADSVAADLVSAWKERDALRAKIEAMELQEPECEVVGQVRNVLYEVRTLKYDLPAGTKLYAIPGAQPAPSVPAEVTREFVMDAIAQALGDAYDCTRVWSAWGYGTMSQDDFHLIAEDSDRLREIADAAIMAMGAAAPKPEGE